MNTMAIRDPNEREDARKKVCLEQLALDRQRLFLKWPFIGGVIMRMELIPVRDDRLETACTDGDNIFVDINFFSRLHEEERLFVLAHEVWHSVLLHFSRCQRRDRLLFNMAADLEIHFTLQNEKMREPFVLPHAPSWATLSAEEIYERLLSRQNREQRLGGGGFPFSHNNDVDENPGKTTSVFGGGKSSFDKHIYQDDDVSSPNVQAGEDGEANASSAQALTKKQNGNKEKGALGTDTNPFVIDQDYNPCVSSESVERSRSRSIASALQLERKQGSLPAHISVLLDRLQKPSLPWQEMLKQFVTTCYGGKRRWLPPARRHVWQELYLPSMRNEALKAVVALDTSGSTQRDLPMFFGELVSLMKSFGKFDLDVIQCDAEIQLVEHYSEANLPPPDKKWEAKGLGSTDFRPVFEYIRKNMHEQPDILLFFTDGFGTAPSHRPPYPIMWVLTSDGNVPAEWGRVIHFKKDG